MKQTFGKFELELLPDPIVSGQTIIPRTTEDMARLLRGTLHFALDKDDNLYLYEDGVYVPAEQSIMQCHIAIHNHYKMKWTVHKANEVKRYLTILAPKLVDRPNSSIINLKNGVYIIKERKFEPHADEFHHWDNLNTIQIPITYDPGATCPQIMEFMSEVFPGGQDLLVDIIGMCMSSFTSNHKAIVLLGEGNNGKSAYLYCLRAAVGRENVSSTSIHKLADLNERFANNDIVGKLVNATDDVAQGKILDTSNIKSIISGNQIRVEGKFRTPTTYVPFCKLIFAANHRLESNDESVGYARRIMHIPFAQTFALNPAKEKELHTIFNDSGEMSGLFNEITKRLSDTLERGLRIPEEVMEFVDNYDPIPDAAIKWLKANVSESPEGRVPIHPFNVVYNLNATWGMERSDIIYRYLKHLFKGISKGKCRIDGGRVNSYMGIGVSEDVRLWMSRVQEGKVVEEEG